MLIQSNPPRHLTYCMNIHPGETWEDVREAVSRYAAAVQKTLGVRDPFGLGLRLSGKAAVGLTAPGERERFQAWLAEHGMYVFTLNGCAHGNFHGGPVKERAYQPDWRTQVRREYTNLLADHLAALLPEGMDGSISTVPGSWKPWIIRPDDADRMVRQWMDCLLHLDQLVERTGRVIHLGLEPAPGCFLESAAEWIRFYNQTLLPRGIDHLRTRNVRNAARAEALIRRHLGVCVDTSHAAVQFEDPVAILDACADAGIRVSKIQLSAGLQVFNERSRIEALHPFVEPVYLHQVKAETRHGAIRSWNDLPDALRVVKDQPEYQRLRVHFHVPLDWSGDAQLGTTTGDLTPAFWQRLRSGDCRHLEMETYTYDVLPPGLKPPDTVAGIAREYAWVMRHWGEPAPGAGRHPA
jgi:sugar phosphate isomerase/epimerase